MKTHNANPSYYHKVLRDRMVAMVIFALVIEQIRAGLFGSGGCKIWPYSIGQDGVSIKKDAELAD